MISARKVFETRKAALLRFAGSSSADELLVMFKEVQGFIGIAVFVVEMVGM